MSERDTKEIPCQRAMVKDGFLLWFPPWQANVFLWFPSLVFLWFPSWQETFFMVSVVGFLMVSVVAGKRFLMVSVLAAASEGRGAQRVG